MMDVILLYLVPAPASDENQFDVFSVYGKARFADVPSGGSLEEIVRSQGDVPSDAVVLGVVQDQRPGLGLDKIILYAEPGLFDPASAHAVGVNCRADFISTYQIPDSLREFLNDTLPRVDQVLVGALFVDSPLGAS